MSQAGIAFALRLSGRYQNPKQLWGNMRAVLLMTILVFGGCTPRGDLGFAPAHPDAQLVTVHSVNTRDASAGVNAFGAARTETVVLERLLVGVPPDHQPGKIEWPRKTPDPARHFAVADRRAIDSTAGFAGSIAKLDRSGQRETVVYVHGYNTTHGEAVYHLTQMTVDLQIPVPVVLFSWQSAGDVRGYIYDRDSALHARDDLETVLRDLTGQGRRVFLVGHSMGSLLIMETLRQIAISGDERPMQRLAGVALMAPDLDPDLFQRQAKRIGSLPQPFIIFVAEQDDVLGLSAFLAGRENRLGTITDLSDLGDLPVRLIDLSVFAEEDDLNHNIGTRSLAAISLIRNLTGNAVETGTIRPEIAAGH